MKENMFLIINYHVLCYVFKVVVMIILVSVIVVDLFVDVCLVI